MREREEEFNKRKYCTVTLTIWNELQGNVKEGEREGRYKKCRQPNYAYLEWRVEGKGEKVKQLWGFNQRRMQTEGRVKEILVQSVYPSTWSEQEPDVKMGRREKMEHAVMKFQPEKNADERKGKEIVGTDSLSICLKWARTWRVQGKEGKHGTHRWQFNQRRMLTKGRVNEN